MSIALHEVDLGTNITVTIQSQSWIIGDAFGFYERYIRNFFSALRTMIETERVSPPMLLPNLVFKKTANWGQIIYFVIALLIFMFIFGSGTFQINSFIGLVFLPFLAIIIAAGIRLINNLRRPE